MAIKTKVPQEEKEFAQLVVKKLGACVADLKQEAAVKMLTDEQTRRILLLTFQIVGKKAELSYAALVQKIRHSL